MSKKKTRISLEEEKEKNEKNENEKTKELKNKIVSTNKK